MNAVENNLVYILTGQPSLQAATLPQLAEIINRYPYFSIGRLLFTKKLKQEKAEGYLQQYQQCALYFPDLFWLQYQLGDTAIINTTPLQPAEGAGFSDELGRAEKPAIAAEAQALSLPGNKVEDANLITLPAQDVLSSISSESVNINDEPELPPLDEEDMEDLSSLTPAGSKIADLLQHQATRFSTPLSEKAVLPLNPEPYHTIDYFASQGIKIDTQQSQDTLAKKVHTFTDWLKQMKRINQYPTDLGSDPDTESFVQSIANTSNQPREVHTETMAEVLVKQGKTDKAIELYQKLSLLNPGKTAYFAAKIHQLKGD